MEDGATADPGMPHRSMHNISDLLRTMSVQESVKLERSAATR